MSDLYAWERPEGVDLTWRHRAACLGMDPNIFHPEAHETDKDRLARATCATCMVRQPCLDEAATLPTDQDHGIRGGLSRRERLIASGRKGGVGNGKVAR